jgi:hypothetical protein
MSCCRKEKDIGAERCECVFYVHMSKASKELKVVLLHLWRVNVKWRIFFYISLADLTWIKPHHNNITNCIIIVKRPQQNICFVIFLSKCRTNWASGLLMRVWLLDTLHYVSFISGDALDRLCLFSGETSVVGNRKLCLSGLPSSKQGKYLLFIKKQKIAAAPLRCIFVSVVITTLLFNIIWVPYI